MRICDLIERQHEDIVAEWANGACEAHRGARALAEPALCNHIPPLLKSLARWLREGEPTEKVEVDASAIQRALQRLDEDISLRDVVDEYRILRSVIQRRAISSGANDAMELVRFNHAVDDAIAVAVDHYDERRQRQAHDEVTRMHLALEASGLGLWEWSLPSNEVTADQRTRALFGWTDGTVRTLDDSIRTVVAADRPLIDEAFKVLAQRDELELEYRIVVGGQERWVRSNASVLERDGSGQAVHLIGTTLDVTTLKRAETRERMSKRELTAYARIGEALTEAKGFDEFLSDLLALFMQSSPDVDTTTILLREDDPERPGGRLRVKASIGLEDETRSGYTIPIGMGFAGTIASSREPMLLHDAARSEIVISEWVRKRGIRAFYGVPLMSNGELVGVAHIGSRITSDFPEEEKRLFAVVAERAANAVAQALLRDQLAKRHAQLEAVIEALPDALLVSDREKVLMVNPSAADMLGLRAAETVGKPIVEVLLRIAPRDPDTGEDVPLAKLPLCRALRGEREGGHFVARHVRSDRELHIRVAAAPVLVGGTVSGAVAVWTDITKVVELELQRDTFMHAVVHDLRNPLQSMIFATHLVSQKIASTYNDTWAIDRLQRLASSALRLDRLLGDLLEVALAKSGKIEINKTPVPIWSVLEEQAAVWSASSTRHDLRVHGCDAAVVADRDRIVQVLDNLLSNAIKYSPGGGCIEVSCVVEDGQARIGVRDEGVGVPAEDQAWIFNPYSRSGRQAWISGHGLGLFISSEIVRQHGGRMGVRSEPGKGSEFWFTLPLAENAGDSHVVH